MRALDIKEGLYVTCKGHIGVVKKCNVEGFCGDKMGYCVQFTGDGGLATVDWWVTADQLEPVRGV